MKVEFESWEQLIDHIKAGYLLWYQPPLDYYPCQVNAVIRRDGKVRVNPIYRGSEPFTVDQGHLSRFRRTRSHQYGMKP